jgi:hypothetical protein
LVTQKPAVHRAVQLPNTWRRTLAPSGAARYFTGAPNFDKLRGGLRGAEAMNAGLLLDPQRLLDTTAFAAPAYHAGISAGGVRDPLSRQEQLAGERPAVEAPEPIERRSQADLMENRLSALRKRVLNEGWAWFQRGEYKRARASFKNAEMLDRKDPEPRAGILFTHLSEAAFMQVVTSAARIMAWDARAPVFDADYRIAERYAPPDVEDPELRRDLGRERLKQHLEVFRRFYGDHKSQPGVQAAAAYLLWQTGGKDEAVLLARRLSQADPHGAYAQFALRMLEANERRVSAATN